MPQSHDVVRSYSYRGRHRRDSYQGRKAALAVTTLGAAAAAPLIGTTAAHADSSVWYQVAQCESTGNWHINNGNGFYGGLQFTYGTWLAYGGGQYASRADLASPQQQIAIGERVLAGQGPGAWPVCSVKAGLTSSTGSGGGSAPARAPQAPAQAPRAQAPQHTESAPSTTTEAPQAAVADPGPAISGTSYVVQSGDTLSKIARRAHVRGGWHTLFTQNRKVLGSNPNLILPGQRLSI